MMRWSSDHIWRNLDLNIWRFCTINVTSTMQSSVICGKSLLTRLLKRTLVAPPKKKPSSQIHFLYGDTLKHQYLPKWLGELSIAIFLYRRYCRRVVTYLKGPNDWDADSFTFASGDCLPDWNSHFVLLFQVLFLGLRVHTLLSYSTRTEGQGIRHPLV